MSWRLARSLIVLRSEINHIAPNRSKTSDGTIGDAAHTSRTSDHNPDDAGVVRAYDATHDPGAGADMHTISEHIRTHRHSALKYIIWNRRIASPTDGWVWRSYNGTNPHTAHMHVSVMRPYDDESPWGLVQEEAMPTPTEIAAAVWAYQLRALTNDQTASAGQLQQWSHYDGYRAQKDAEALRAGIQDLIRAELERWAASDTDYDELAARLANEISRRLSDG